MNLTPEQLELITLLPREEWGLGFIVMSRCLKHHDDAKGSLKRYFSHSMKLARIDELRSATRRSSVRRDDKLTFVYRPMVYTDKLPERWSRPQPVDPVPELTTTPTLYLFARGLSYRQIADDTGKPKGTVRSTIARERDILRSARGEPACLPSRGGIYRGSDSERSIRSTESETK